MSTAHRFKIRRDPWFSPLLALFGGTKGLSYVEIRGASLYARFGWYSVEIPMASIKSAGRAKWAWYAGIGWRSNLRSILGLIGSYEGVVHLVIEPRARVRLLLIPFGLRDLYISLEDPAGFLTGLAGRGVGAAGQEPPTAA